MQVDDIILPWVADGVPICDNPSPFVIGTKYPLLSANCTSLKMKYYKPDHPPRLLYVD